VNAPLRAVFDTNVVVSAFVFRAGRLAWLREAILNRTTTPLVSDDTLRELLRVLAYPRLRLDPPDRENVLLHYMEHAETFRNPAPKARIPACRDVHDEMFLRLAYGARAAALVTGDADLLDVADQSRFPIMTPAQFEARLR
jgi:putative PIN family toxin of toxin-antitoxin system